ncbi:hypothetical protein I4U23_013509 [Adineta vaga]|nr:hypothetical protein I4U23_013509 [Adineta vaga]
MLGDERRSIRSPTTSPNGSYRDERDDNEYEEPSNDLEEQPRNDGPPLPAQDQYISALRHRFPNRSKNDYVYSKPIGPSNQVLPTPPTPLVPPASSTSQPSTKGTTVNTSGQSNGRYETTSRPTIGGLGRLDISSDRTFPKPALRRVTPDQQNSYAKRITNESPTTNSASKPTPPGPSVRINEGDTVANRPTPPRFTPQSGIPSERESTFEKVASHGGPVSYLGTGTFSQFEHCLRECLERERRHTGIVSQITRQDVPSSTFTNEYDYDPCVPSSSSSSRPIPRSSSSHHYPDYPSRAVGTFTLDDIRHINIALSRNGISLFPYERSYCRDFDPCSTSIPCTTYPNEQHRNGEVVSACRVVEEDPALLYNKRGY